MSEHEELMDLIRNEYDPKPNLGRGDYPAFDWDDGAGRIADAILADKALLLRKCAEEMRAQQAALKRAYEFLQDKSFTPDSLTHECTRVVEQIAAALSFTSGEAK